MFTEAHFATLTKEVARANNLTEGQAGEFVALFGDTPELADDGRVIVRDAQGKELARLICPQE